MITTTHSHKHWTDEGGHVKLTAGGVQPIEVNLLVTGYAERMAGCRDPLLNRHV